MWQRIREENGVTYFVDLDIPVEEIVGMGEATDRDLRDQSIRELRVVVGRTTMAASNFVGLLVMLFQRCNLTDRRLMIANRSAFMNGIIELCGLTDVLPLTKEYANRP